MSLVRRDRRPEHRARRSTSVMPCTASTMRSDLAPAAGVRRPSAVARMATRLATSASSAWSQRGECALLLGDDAAGIVDDRGRQGIQRQHDGDDGRRLGVERQMPPAGGRAATSVVLAALVSASMPSAIRSEEIAEIVEWLRPVCAAISVRDGWPARRTARNDQRAIAPPQIVVTDSCRHVISPCRSLPGHPRQLAAGLPSQLLRPHADRTPNRLTEQWAAVSIFSRLEKKSFVSREGRKLSRLSGAGRKS